MLDSIYNWCVKRQDNISWFFIGLTSMACYNSLINGDWIWAGVYAVLSYFNYFGTKFRMQ